MEDRDLDTASTDEKASKKPSIVELPKPGIVIKPVDVDSLTKIEGVEEKPLADYQKAAGFGWAISYDTGEVSEFGWKHTMYYLLDARGRLGAFSENEAGMPSSTRYEYDELDRVVREERNMGFTFYETLNYTYDSDTPDSEGKFPFEEEKISRSGLRISPSESK
jgi:hypothetical protein